MPVTDSNPVGTLQEHAQSEGGTFPQYQLLQAVGESHCPSFTIQVRFGELCAEGMAANKKLAKHEAARSILALIRAENGTHPKSEEENTTNKEKMMDKNIADIEDTDLKHTAVQKMYSGNKIGELQEYCMGRGLGMPTYANGETSGPSHMRHFTIMCAVGSVERVGAGGTKKEAKRQAAGAVLEEISFPDEKTKDTEQKDHEKTNGKVNEPDQVEEDTNQKQESIGLSNELSSSKNKEEAKPVITTNKFGEEGLNRNLEDLNSEVLEDHAHANTPEESDE
jgi:dsRNA-specific ribonuclease